MTAEYNENFNITGHVQPASIEILSTDLSLCANATFSSVSLRNFSLCRNFTSLPEFPSGFMSASKSIYYLNTYKIFMLIIWILANELLQFILCRGHRSKPSPGIPGTHTILLSK